LDIFKLIHIITGRVAQSKAEAVCSRIVCGFDWFRGCGGTRFARCQDVVVESGDGLL
jgi:type IV secretory pathway VirB2 component (pilin)